MKQSEIISHYTQYYQFQNLSDQDAMLQVNQLLPRIQKNDQQAFGTALRIICEKAYFNVCRKVAGGKFDTLDFVDDIIQYASTEFAAKSMTGFSNLDHENFYAYSLKLFSLCTTHYISRHYKKVVKREFPMDDGNQMIDKDRGDYNENNGKRSLTDSVHSDNPEQILIEQQQEENMQECIALYIHSIEESKIVPYQLITYCYAAVLTIILKDHKNIPQLLKWINRLNRPGQRSSWADEKTGEIGGRIARDSTYLLKWAVDAMYKKNLEYLSNEFTQIYNIRPLAGRSFAWGIQYRNSLEEINFPEGQQRSKKMGELIITDEFQEDEMKNWAPRVNRKLMKEVAAAIVQNPRLRSFAVEYAENQVAGKKCSRVV